MTEKEGVCLLPGEELPAVTTTSSFIGFDDFGGAFGGTGGFNDGGFNTGFSTTSTTSTTSTAQNTQNVQTVQTTQNGQTTTQTTVTQ